MNKLVKYSAAALFAAGLFGMSTQTAHAATGYQRLTHNAYAYNVKGQRANKKLYRKGSRVRVIGSITLNGKKYNIISGNVYIKASNFRKARANANADLGEGYETSLIRNSYVYNSKGQRIKGMKLRKGHSVTYYGQPVRIRGKKYVLIGANQYVRSCNVLLSYDGPTGSDSLNHTHHNAATSTPKRNSSNNSTSTGALSSSSANGSKQSNSSNSTTNSSSSSSSSKSDTSKTDSNKKDTNKKDSNKQTPSKSDSKTSSKSTDNKGTKDDTKNTGAKATSADYEALSDAIIKSQEADKWFASYPKQKALDDATNNGRQYLTFHNTFGQNDYSTKEIQDAIAAINTAINNLDSDAVRAEIPQVTVKNGVWDWTPDKIQQALDVVNKIYGSKDAHIVKGVKGHSMTEIVCIDAYGTPRSFLLNEYGKAVYAN